MSREVERQFPGIRWISTPPSAQWRNGLIERNFGLAKQYVHSVFQTKQTDPVPHFTSEGLWLICKEISNFFNSRAISWLKSADIPISPNLFLKTYSAPGQGNGEIWTNPYKLEKAFENLEEFRSRMRKLLREYYQSSNFVATKWYNAKRPLSNDDIVLHCRKQSKFSKGIQEYGRVIDCSDQRNVQLMVSRGGTKKLVDVDSRNIIPIMQSQDDLHNVCGEC